MNQIQEQAIREKFSINVEEIKDFFRNPRSRQLDNMRSLLIVTHTSMDNDEYIWHCAIRIQKQGKNVKPTSMWMKFEQLGVRGQAILELDGVGESASFKEWTSDYCYHIQKTLTAEEKKILEEVMEKKKAQGQILDAEILE